MQRGGDSGESNLVGPILDFQVCNSNYTPMVSKSHQLRIQSLLQLVPVHILRARILGGHIAPLVLGGPIASNLNAAIPPATSMPLTSAKPSNMSAPATPAMATATATAPAPPSAMSRARPRGWRRQIGKRPEGLGL